jgi:hypothetical protein
MICFVGAFTIYPVKKSVWFYEFQKYYSAWLQYLKVESAAPGWKLRMKIICHR